MMEVVTCAILSSPLHRGIEQNEVILIVIVLVKHKDKEKEAEKKVGIPCSISFPGSPAPPIFELTSQQRE